MITNPIIIEEHDIIVVQKDGSQPLNRIIVLVLFRNMTFFL